MHIGFDIDGVLANFVLAYQALVVQKDGRNLFHPDDVNNPPCWDWPEYRGYSKEVIGRVWQHITESPSFWFNLTPHPENVSALSLVLLDLEYKHDVYFITSRPGNTAKRQTEAWLRRHLRYDDDTAPTALLASSKGAAAKALKLDVYLDDNLDNIKDVLRESPKTRAYLLDRSYNQGDVRVDVNSAKDAITGNRERIGVPVFDFETRTGVRVSTLSEMLDIELLNL